MISHRWGGTSSAVDLYHPPKHLQGTAGAARLRARPVDICCIVVYLPPRAHRQQSSGKWKTTVSGLINWVQQTLHQLPNRCTPIVVGDFNSELGESRTQRGQLGRDDIHIGRFCNGRPTYAGELLTSLLKEEGLAVVNTFWQRGGPTYWGNTETSQRTLDYLIVPVTALDGVRSCAVWRHEGRSLQVIASARPRDHYPVVAVLEVGKPN